ncbi:MAG: helix-turn-helix domain-containing protein [Patescibacteria group bacterium]
MTEWLTTKEASDYLGVSIRTIQRYVKGNKLKYKTVDGKTILDKEELGHLKPVATNTPITASTPAESNQMLIPEGYILIDKETLDSLRNQIKTLTDNVGEMQLTQKLLIEKGLNLKELPDAVPTEAAKSDSSANENRENQVGEIISQSFDPVAKAHEEFFGHKRKNNSLTIILSIAVIAALIVIGYLLLNIKVN